ncbi:MAG TPA: MFS transporter [Acidimicrobiales bacterium]|nr:MFS transporter [Acidimicrobiales bacterium]
MAGAGGALSATDLAEAHVEGTTALAVAKRYGWFPIFALATTLAIQNGEMSSLSQAIPGIEHAFRVSDVAVGFIPFAMAGVGIIGAIPMGILADRLRRTRLLAAATALWTACMAFNGAATSYLMVFLGRLGVGGLEATSPASTSLIADHYPVQDRGRMMGYYQAGSLAGSLLGFVGGGVAVAVGGWRWAFWMWVPAGLLVCWFMLRTPEPERGHQDAHFLAEADGASPAAAVTTRLGAPTRTGTLDYERASLGQVAREFLHIRTMWLGIVSLTVSGLLLNGLSFWAVPYFRRVHHMGPAQAGLVTSVLGVSAIVGILGGGTLADRLMRRGVVCARVYVIAIASLAATPLLAAAFASTDLPVTIPLFAFGGVAVTLPVAPAEAMLTDVVVARLRGRAASVRSALRSASTVGPLVIGAMSTLIGLRLALVALTPIYAIGGLLMLLALRTYPRDLAFVLAESRRRPS